MELKSWYTGTVLQCIDGDTIWMNIDGQRTRVRIAFIDAPEADQSFARQSKEALEKMLLGRPCTIFTRTWDRYGRVVASIECQKKDPAMQLLWLGLAVVYRPAGAPALYLEAEREAMTAQRGLHSLNGFEKPEKYRARLSKFRILKLRT